MIIDNFACAKVSYSKNIVAGLETKIEMVCSKYQNSKNFSDKVFDF